MVCGRSPRPSGWPEDGDELKFVAGSSELPFSEVLRFREDRYGLEEMPVRRWLDAAAGEEAPYSASRVRYESRKLDTRKKDLALAEGLPVAETGEAGQA